MADPFIAQIVMFGGNFAPRGWAFCDGQLLPIAQNTALFSLLGITFGGDGRVTFGLPDLRGRDAIHPGTGPGLPTVNLGHKGGTHNVTLNANNIPSHTHKQRGNSGAPVETNPENGFCANSAQITNGELYAASGNVDMGATTATGAGQSFTVTEPFLGINHIIALQGIFPSRNAAAAAVVTVHRLGNNDGGVCFEKWAVTALVK